MPDGSRPGARPGWTWPRPAGWQRVSATVTCWRCRRGGSAGARRDRPFPTVHVTPGLVPGVQAAAPGTPAACLEVSVDVPGGAAAHVLVPRWGGDVVVRVDGAVVAAITEGDYAAVDVGPGAHTVTTC